LKRRGQPSHQPRLTSTTPNNSETLRQIAIKATDEGIKQIAQENESCRRLVTIPRVGPVTATALIAAIGNGAAFRKGREFAAWIGVVPREYSTRGKQKLLGISKRGKQYSRFRFNPSIEKGADPTKTSFYREPSDLRRYLEIS
jgi:transposase